MSDGSPFSIFKTRKPVEEIDSIGRLSVDDVVPLLDRFSKSNSTVLELAATIHWLSHVERVPNWRDELVRRKGSKTKNGRMERAVELLSEIGVDV
ncbi:hypothetical protein KUL72_19225 [Bradyrhizobium arachidis]|uniref:hypothetical protein n=1 Tax=Bradyrhizobium arachidis TaxID=858423 RepID=UPI0021612C7F|nr:hypothetical protein [Bradyrhizobium arachidis]UVO33663.1 hypothetical protein KUL72_19225 [Bradyrhizobium arachidis]